MMRACTRTGPRPSLPLIAMLALLCWCGAAQAQDDGLWQALKQPGHAVLLRHAVAPGFGDPEHFDVADCATQRNLSEDGRRQSRRIGALFRDHGIAGAEVYSSQWCRCLETARLLALGPVRPLALLNSFFRRPADGERQIPALRRWLADAPLATPTILVTHQVNITGLTGVFPSSGELVVIRRGADGRIETVGTLPTDALARDGG